MPRSEEERLQGQLAVAREDLENLLKTQDEATTSTARYREEVASLADTIEDYEKQLEESDSAQKELYRSAQEVVNSLGLTNEIATKVFTKLDSGWQKVSQAVEKAANNNTAYFESLNSIVGLNGELGQLGNTLRGLSSGTVGKADLASFFGSTGSLFQNAQAMEQTAGYARDLIAAYGSANVAAQKYQDTLLLSEDSQKAMQDLVKEQAKIVEQSSAGQLKALKTQAQEAMDSLGASLLITAKPVIEFFNEIVQAFKDVSGVQALDDQTDALAKNLELTEEQKKAAEELNDIERLRATGFTSSLDEVHEIGSMYVEAKEQAEEEADAVVEGEGAKQNALTATSEKARSLAESLYKVVEVTQEVGETFGNVFASIGPGLISTAAGVLKVAGTVLEWLNDVNMLLPILGVLGGLLASLKVAQLAYAAAVAVAKVAEGGPAAPIIAASIVAGIGIVAGAGLGIAASAIGGSSSSSYNTNSYSGIENDVSKANVSVYLDGKKVNDELAYEKSLNTEVVIK